MAEPDNFDTRDRAHISIDVFRETAAYTFPSRNQERKPLRGDYTAHATQLLDQLAAALGTVPAAAADPRLPIQGLKSGTVVEVTTLPPAEDSRIKAVKVPAALEFPTQDVVILRSERNEDRTESALVFVPDDARAFLRNRIADYGRDPGNQRRPDAERFEVIEEVRAAEAVSLFTGEVDLAAPDILWWELWVRQPVALADRLVAAARNANIDVHGDRLIFPDTTVVFIHAVAAAVAAFAARSCSATASGPASWAATGSSTRRGCTSTSRRASAILNWRSIAGCSRNIASRSGHSSWVRKCRYPTSA
ncbi:hypothetical protein OMR07_08690 [Methylobacterium organophilum]|nr:hypothetical protein [Methylobacterium organophilum]